MKDRVRLRDTTREDLPTLFKQQADPEANRMAGFTRENPSDREAFAAHWDRILRDGSITMKTILLDEKVAGHIGSFEREGALEITYWIGRKYWGKGIASRALSEFLTEMTVRPVYARAAKDNLGSIRVLEKNGFTLSGHDRFFANARGEEIDEVILVLQ